MLNNLNATADGVCIDNFSHNNFAYADDVTLLAATVSGLQNLRNCCFSYSKLWHFSFGIKKILTV